MKLQAFAVTTAVLSVLGSVSGRYVGATLDHRSKTIGNPAEEDLSSYHDALQNLCGPGLTKNIYRRALEHGISPFSRRSWTHPDVEDLCAENAFELSNNPSRIRRRGQTPSTNRRPTAAALSAAAAKTNSASFEKAATQAREALATAGKSIQAKGKEVKDSSAGIFNKGTVKSESALENVKSEAASVAGKAKSVFEDMTSRAKDALDAASVETVGSSTVRGLDGESSTTFGISKSSNGEGIFGTMSEGTKSGARTIGSGFSSLFDSISKFMSPVTTPVSNFFSSNKASDSSSNLSEAIRKACNGASSCVLDAASGLMGICKGAGNCILKSASKTCDAAGKCASSIGNACTSPSSPTKCLTDGVKGGANAVGDAGRWIGSQASRAAGYISSSIGAARDVAGKGIHSGEKGVSDTADTLEGGKKDKGFLSKIGLGSGN